ncbi:MAG: hypothetical protein KF819_37780 [Labilithrix sp.]|nr:hypothetical protein [Labilithrix sp.]
MRRVVPALVLVIALSACDEKKPAPPPTPSAAPTAASVIDAAPPASAEPKTEGKGKHDAHMANCPTAAPGATVALKDVEGGIEIAITGKDEASTKDIKARTAKLVEADKHEAEAGVRHTGKGEGGGQYGRCTIVMRNTTLETADIKDGVKATVKAKDKSEIDWLRRETRDRDKESKAPGAEGAGANKMAHCPSAVEGAKTTVKDTKEGVVVTVTAAGDKADKVKEIRDRAGHAAEVAKMAAPPKVEHNSEGKGGGGLGRCPIVVEGDTIVEVKEIEGGAEITVKAKKDVAALQKEVKARAANFGAK